MQHDYNNKNLTKFSQNLRKNMTKEERKLWYNFLNGLEWKFKRQRVIGKYIADFYCAEKKTIIEIDGSQHFENENIIKDDERTKFFNSLGINVLRYNNRQINQVFNLVCEDIYNELNKTTTLSST